MTFVEWMKSSGVYYEYFFAHLHIIINRKTPAFAGVLFDKY